MGLEELVEFFLGNFLSQVANQEVGVSIKLLVTLLKTNAEEFSIKFEIVHGFGCLFSFFLTSEGHESVVEGLLGEVVNTDSGSDGAVALGLEEFLQLKVEEVGGQVSNVNCWRALLLLLRSVTTTLVLLVDNALEHLLHASISLGTTTAHAHLLRRTLALHLVGIGVGVHLLLLVVHVLLGREVAHNVLINSLSALL